MNGELVHGFCKITIPPSWKGYLNIICSMLFMHRVAFRMYIILTYQKKKKVI